MLAVIGFFARLVVFGEAELALWLTLGVEPVAFVLTSLFAVMRYRVVHRSGLSAPMLIMVILLCLASAALLAGMGHVIHWLLDSPALHPVDGKQYRLGLIYYTGILFIWALIYFGVEAELAVRNERLEKMNAEAHALRLELEHLQTQIAPHFLFNCLNTIVAEVGSRPEVAEEMTRQLAEYLRHSLDRHGAGLCRVQDDIEAAQAYVRIQALRFERSLSLQLHVDPGALDRRIPHMTLQGLVENAIKHGVHEEGGPIVIQMRIRCEGDALTIRVSNEGPLSASFDGTRGGLGNLCRRLALRYPQGCAFSLNQHDGLTIAELRVSGEPRML